MTRYFNNPELIKGALPMAPAAAYISTIEKFSSLPRHLAPSHTAPSHIAPSHIAPSPGPLKEVSRHVTDALSASKLDALKVAPVMPRPLPAARVIARLESPSIMRLDVQKALQSEIERSAAKSAAPPLPSAAPQPRLEDVFARPVTPPQRVVQEARLETQIKALPQGDASTRATQAVQKQLQDEALIRNRLSPAQIKARDQFQIDQHYGTVGPSGPRTHMLKAAGLDYVAQVTGLVETVAQATGQERMAKALRDERKNYEEAAAHRHQKAKDAGHIVEWEQVVQSTPTGLRDHGFLLNTVFETIQTGLRVGDYAESLLLQSLPDMAVMLGGGVAGRAAAAKVGLNSPKLITAAGIGGATLVSVPVNSGRVLGEQREQSMALTGQEKTHLPAALGFGLLNSALNAAMGVERMFAVMKLPGRAGELSAKKVGLTAAAESLVEMTTGASERWGAKVAVNELEYFGPQFYSNLWAQARDGFIAGGSITGAGQFGSGFGKRGGQARSTAITEQLEAASAKTVDAEGKVHYVQMAPQSGYAVKPEPETPKPAPRLTLVVDNTNTPLTPINPLEYDPRTAHWFTRGAAPTDSYDAQSQQWQVMAQKKNGTNGGNGNGGNGANGGNGNGHSWSGASGSLLDGLLTRSWKDLAAENGKHAVPEEPVDKEAEAKKELAVERARFDRILAELDRPLLGHLETLLKLEQFKEEPPQFLKVDIWSDDYYPAVRELQKMFGLASETIYRRMRDYYGSAKAAIEHVDGLVRFKARFADNIKQNLLSLIESGETQLLQQVADIFKKSRREAQDQPLVAALAQKLNGEAHPIPAEPEQQWAHLNRQLEVLAWVGKSPRLTLARIAGDPRGWAVRTEKLLLPITQAQIEGLLTHDEIFELQRLARDVSAQASVQARKEALSNKLGYSNWNQLVLAFDGHLSGVAEKKKIQIGVIRLIEAGNVNALLGAAKLLQDLDVEQRPLQIEQARSLAAALEGEAEVHFDSNEALQSVVRNAFDALAWRGESPLETAQRISKKPRDWVAGTEILKTLRSEDVLARLTHEEVAQLQRYAADDSPSQEVLAGRTALAQKLGFPSWALLTLLYRGDLTSLNKRAAPPQDPKSSSAFSLSASQEPPRRRGRPPKEASALDAAAQTPEEARQEFRDRLALEREQASKQWDALSKEVPTEWLGLGNVLFWISRVTPERLGVMTKGLKRTALQYLYAQVMYALHVVRPDAVALPLPNALLGQLSAAEMSSILQRTLGFKYDLNQALRKNIAAFDLDQAPLAVLALLPEGQTPLSVLENLREQLAQSLKIKTPKSEASKSETQKSQRSSTTQIFLNRDTSTEVNARTALRNPPLLTSEQLSWIKDWLGQVEPKDMLNALEGQLHQSSLNPEMHERLTRADRYPGGRVSLAQDLGAILKYLDLMRAEVVLQSEQLNAFGKLSSKHLRYVLPQLEGALTGKWPVAEGEGSKYVMQYHVRQHAALGANYFHALNQLASHPVSRALVLESGWAQRLVSALQELHQKIDATLRSRGPIDKHRPTTPRDFDWIAAAAQQGQADLIARLMAQDTAAAEQALVKTEGVSTWAYLSPEKLLEDIEGLRQYQEEITKFVVQYDAEALRAVSMPELEHLEHALDAMVVGNAQWSSEKNSNTARFYELSLRRTLGLPSNYFSTLKFLAASAVDRTLLLDPVIGKKFIEQVESWRLEIKRAYEERKVKKAKPQNTAQARAEPESVARARIEEIAAHLTPEQLRQWISVLESGRFEGAGYLTGLSEAYEGGLGELRQLLADVLHKATPSISPVEMPTPSEEATSRTTATDIVAPPKALEADGPTLKEFVAYELRRSHSLVLWSLMQRWGREEISQKLGIAKRSIKTYGTEMRQQLGIKAGADIALAVEQRFAADIDAVRNHLRQIYEDHVNGLVAPRRMNSTLEDTVQLSQLNHLKTRHLYVLSAQVFDAAKHQAIWETFFGGLPPYSVQHLKKYANQTSVRLGIADLAEVANKFEGGIPALGAKLLELIDQNRRAPKDVDHKVEQVENFSNESSHNPVEEIQPTATQLSSLSSEAKVEQFAEDLLELRSAQLYFLAKKEATYLLHLITQALEQQAGINLENPYPYSRSSKNNDDHKISFPIRKKLNIRQLNPTILNSFLNQKLEWTEGLKERIQRAGGEKTILSNLHAGLIRHLNRLPEGQGLWRGPEVVSWLQTAYQQELRLQDEYLKSTSRDERIPFVDPALKLRPLSSLNSYGLTPYEENLLTHLVQGKSYEQILAANQKHPENAVPAGLDALMKRVSDIRKKIGTSHEDLGAAIHMMANQPPHDVRHEESGYQIFGQPVTLLQSVDRPSLREPSPQADLTPQRVNQLTYNGMAVLQGWLERGNVQEISAQTGLRPHVVKIFVDSLPRLLGVGSLSDLRSYPGHLEKLKQDVDLALYKREANKKSRQKKASEKTEGGTSLVIEATIPRNEIAPDQLVKKLLAFDDVDIKILWAYLDGSFERPEIGNILGLNLAAEQVEIGLNRIARGLVGSNKLKELEPAIQRITEPGQSTHELLWELVKNKRVWAQGQNFVSMLTWDQVENVLNQFLPLERKFLKLMIQHGENHEVLSQHAGVKPSAATNYRRNVFSAFGVDRLNELDMRIPGGLTALSDYLEAQ